MQSAHVCRVWAVWSLTTVGNRFKREITHSCCRSWSGVSGESIAVWPLKLLPPGQSEAGYVPHYWLWHFCPKNRTLQSLSGSDQHSLWIYDIHTGLDFYRVLVARYPDEINAEGLKLGKQGWKRGRKVPHCGFVCCRIEHNSCGNLQLNLSLLRSEMTNPPWGSFSNGKWLHKSV